MLRAARSASVDSSRTSWSRPASALSRIPASRPVRPGAICGIQAGSPAPSGTSMSPATGSPSASPVDMPGGRTQGACRPAIGQGRVAVKSGCPAWEASDATGGVAIAIVCSLADIGTITKLRQHVSYIMVNEGPSRSHQELPHLLPHAGKHIFSNVMHVFLQRPGFGGWRRRPMMSHGPVRKKSLWGRHPTPLRCPSSVDESQYVHPDARPDPGTVCLFGQRLQTQARRRCHAVVGSECPADL